MENVMEKNDARKASTARTKLQRAEQAIVWLLWELECDQSGHGGVVEAAKDIYPEIANSKYDVTWPDSYDHDEDGDSKSYICKPVSI